ncbi:SsgA family sporulation/cell division regulator [Streptomyces griseoviridis]|uniref:SsgA family sporulation/cell division regulator n=1 Tax=Streptomyces griseoviridis TaxID=45398 RepID=UPI00167596BB|nr:SsgA family sporulation/cell division regulator [Streptomyces niveoruber]
MSTHTGGAHDRVPARGQDVTACVPAVLAAGASRGRAVSLRCTYVPRDPFAVMLELPGDAAADGLRWYCARDLLQSGLRRPSGEGDVRVWPPCRRGGREEVRVLLRDGFGSFLLEVRAQPLRNWLVRTWEAVAPGQEDDWSDWDAWLLSLLDG